jgi:circadian clock protein KaiC
MGAKKLSSKSKKKLTKTATGIEGLDHILQGGIPRGRTTLVCGGAGSGKTVLGVELIIRGAVEAGEPGVIVAFEETPEELSANVASLGFDLERLIAQKKIAVDYVHLDGGAQEEVGEYDLEGLFVRLGECVRSVRAKRVMLDSLEALFAGFRDHTILRSEMRRLFRWLKDRKITGIVTAERGDGPLTRHGLEEYVSDCVIVLDQRMSEDVATRKLRVLKYRGSGHGTNEYPFLIGPGGISVLPITSIGLDYQVSSERVTSGIQELDSMLGGKGYFRGSSVLITGTAGTGKSSLAAHFLDATARSGKKGIFFALEEPASQVIRNMRSIGMDLERWVDKGLLRIEAFRPTSFGLESHLATMHRLIEEAKPSAIVIDPVSSLLTGADERDVNGMLVRLLDFLKTRSITSFMTSLGSSEHSEVGVSSLIDTWLHVREIETDAERNRALYLLKSRGMAHSNQVREFLITDHGVRLVDVYVGPSGVLAGSARASQEARDQAEALLREQVVLKNRRELTRREAAFAAKLQALRAEHESSKEEIELGIQAELARASRQEADRERQRVTREGA